MSNLVVTPARVDRDDLEWFKQNYPHGSFSWFVRTSLHFFREAHKEDPSNLIRSSVEQTKESFKESNFEEESF